MGLMHLHNATIVPFFMKQTVQGHIYLFMFTKLCSQMPEQTIFQKDRTLAHYHIDGQDFLNEKFFGRLGW